MQRTATSLAALALALALALVSPAVAARDQDGVQDGSRAQERLERDLQRAAERADELAARTAEERSRIEERALRDPDQAVEERLKLDADTTREEARLAEEQAKIEEDFAEESAKETEDAAEDLADQTEDAADDAADALERGSSEQMRDLGAAEGAEHDEDGFPVRRGEVVAVDLAPDALATAQARGFRLIERRDLAGFDRVLTRLAAPEGVTSLDAREQLRRIDPAATIDLVHYYALNLTAGGHGRAIRRGGSGAPTGTRAQHGTGPLTLGMIDTAVGRHAALGATQVVPWAAGALATAPVEHGTAVASLLAQEGSSTIYAANIFRGPAARPYTSADVIAEALEWMIASKVTTVNMSLAGPRNAILDRLIRDAAARGFQVVAAAGNGGPTAPPAYPAALPGVIAVTAVDSDLHIYRYANRGRYIAVAARGVGVVAARSNGGLARFDGTSFATPHVAGWIARCRAQGATPTACRDRLQKAARDLGPAGFDETYGHGLIE